MTMTEAKDILRGMLLNSTEAEANAIIKILNALASKEKTVDALHIEIQRLKGEAKQNE